MKALYQLIGMSKQAHHQSIERERRREANSRLWINLIEETRGVHPGMGVRQIYDLTRPQGIGRDAFVDLGMSQGYGLETKSNPSRTTFSVKSARYGNLLEGREFTDVNQIWTSDLTYFQWRGQNYYIFMILDVYSRRIVGHAIADNMRAENNVRALKMALALRKIANYNQTLIHHSDKGTQYTSNIYTQTLDEYGIMISMCNEVYENTHIERLNGTIKNQYLHRFDVNTQKELFQKLNRVVKAYNEERPHLKLKGLSPNKFEQQIKELPTEKRTVLTIYTNSELLKQYDLKKNQMQLQLEL